MKRKAKTIDLRCPVNPVGPSGKGKYLVRKNVRFLSDCSAEGLLRLRNYVALKEGVEPENILFGHDRGHCMRSLLKVLNPSSVACQWPASWWLRSFFSQISVPLAELALPPAGTLPGDTVGAEMVLVSRPHEVTGEVMVEDDLAALRDCLAGTGRSLIVDESSRGFVDSDPLGSSFINSPCCAVVRSFTPFYGLTMLRLGYVAGNRKTIQALSTIMKEDEISPLACWAALASLQDKGFARRTQFYCAGERAFMLKSLERFPEIMSYDTGGNSILVVLPSRKEALREELLSRGLLVDAFRDGEGNVHLRLPVGKHAVNARLVRTLRKAIEGGLGR